MLGLDTLAAWYASISARLAPHLGQKLTALHRLLLLQGLAFALLVAAICSSAPTCSPAIRRRRGKARRAEAALARRSPTIAPRRALTGPLHRVPWPAV